MYATLRRGVYKCRFGKYELCVLVALFNACGTLLDVLPHVAALAGDLSTDTVYFWTLKLY